MESAMEMRKEQMAKLIKIEDCAVCPHCAFLLGGRRCKRHNRQLDNEYFPEIPHWCTLYDAEPIAEDNRREAFKKIRKRTIEDNKDLLKELEKL